VTWDEAEIEEETRGRLEELGYMNGGHAYEFVTPREDLDALLGDIENATGLNFRKGDDGHATLSGSTLRITSKREIPDSELEEIEKAVQ